MIIAVFISFCAKIQLFFELGKILGNSSSKNAYFKRNALIIRGLIL